MVLIMSPWNYPFLLSISPLIDAIAAGNSVVLKPSAYSPASSHIIHGIIDECFPAEYVSVVEGGRKENSRLLDIHFDYIFFTGSKNVGQLVLSKAAQFVTPVTLELGGKSPCIVENSANIENAARKIVFGKYLNLGQTCIAPDYLLVENKIKDQLLAAIQTEIARQFGESPLNNPDYGRIINEKHFHRLINLLNNEDIFCGGKTDDNLRIEPTVVVNVSTNSPLMQEEIFGPILPVLGFDTIDEALSIVALNPTPLALYLFTENKEIGKYISRSVSFGGGCINDTIIHLATSSMGFGGIGTSGMGAYHGKTGFDTFTHYKSMVSSNSGFDLPLRYQPYNETKNKLVRRILK